MTQRTDPEIELDEPIARQTEAVEIKVTYDRHKGDPALNPEDWAFRLRLGGLDVHQVEITTPSAKVTRRKRAEPRS